MLEPSRLTTRTRWVALALVGGLLSSACGAPRPGAPAGPGAVGSSSDPSSATSGTATQGAAPAPSAAASDAPPPMAGPAASARGAASTGVAAPAARATLRLERTIPAGKWPEGVAVANGVAWVAESGSRRVLRVALEGDAPPAQVAVGRLPVEIAWAPNGKLYTLAHTDKTLWEIDPTTARARILATVPDCATSMAIAEGAAWVLQWSKCSSAGSSVVRVELATGRQSASPETGRNAWDLGVAGGRAWVTLSDGTLRSLDARSLQDLRAVGTPLGEGPRSALVASPEGVFATHGKVLTRTDPASALRTHQVTLAEPIAAMTLDAGTLLAIGHQGTIWELDAATLAARRELASPTKDAMPHAIARHGDRFVVTDHGPDGERGRLLVLSAPASSPQAGGRAGPGGP